MVVIFIVWYVGWSLLDDCCIINFCCCLHYNWYIDGCETDKNNTWVQILFSTSSWFQTHVSNLFHLFPSLFACDCYFTSKCCWKRNSSILLICSRLITWKISDGRILGVERSIRNNLFILSSFWKSHLFHHVNVHFSCLSTIWNLWWGATRRINL